MMLKVAVAACAITIVLLIIIDGMAEKISRLELEVESMEGAVQTYERIMNADVGSGDVDDDTRWLCKRSGRGDCGP